MFEAAELGRRVSKREYKEREPALREKLIAAQGRLRQSDCPVLVLFSGVDGAGKGETANLLSNEWLDPHWARTHAYGPPTEDERERPHYWKYWRDLPPKGSIGLFLSPWYHDPLLDRVYGRISNEEFEDRLERIIAFERMLAADGALIVKFWMHLGKEQQHKRLETLQQDANHAWRVSDLDWKHWSMYDRFVEVSERILMRTSRGHAPWHIVEGADARFRSLRVGSLLLDALQNHLDERESFLERMKDQTERDEAHVGSDEESVPSDEPDDFEGGPRSVLGILDLSKKLSSSSYKKQLQAQQARLNLLHRLARSAGMSTVLVFEGWDAGGKGGAIRRMTSALDARDVEVTGFSAPSDEEAAQHYLWRFWRQLTRAGKVLIFDRSWYGRVLVERVEGFATRKEWSRAYAEINQFEQQLVEHGTVVLKFWLHISPEEQAARFQSREETPHKRWKLTAEDWRNRDKWQEYETAVNDMVERTSTRIAPWILVEGEDKRFARVKVITSVCDALEEALGRRGDREGRPRAQGNGKRGKKRSRKRGRSS